MTTSRLPTEDIVQEEEGECTNGAWSAPPRPPKITSINATVEEKTPLLSTSTTPGVTETTDKKGLIMSIVILLLSIPALIGAWCWPALVIGLISGTVTAAARALGHYISFGVTAAMMIGVNAYILYCCLTKRKKQAFCKKYGPLIFTIVAALLIMADLTRHLLQDLNIWPSGPWPGSSEYRADCPTETMRCLSILGVFFTVVATYTGFIFLFIGTMWNANIIAKLKQIRTKWKLLRIQYSSKATP